MRAPGNHWNWTNRQYKVLLTTVGSRVGKTTVMNISIFQYASKKEVDKTPGAGWVDNWEQWFPDTGSECGLYSPGNKEGEKQTRFLGCTESHTIKPMLKLI